MTRAAADRDLAVRLGRAGARLHPPCGHRAIGVALIALLAATACGARTLESSDAAEKISVKLKEQQPGLRGLVVSCPVDIRAETSTTFTCSFAAEGGFGGQVQVTQVDDQGTLSIRYPAPPDARSPTTGTMGTVVAVPGTSTGRCGEVQADAGSTETVGGTDPDRTAGATADPSLGPADPNGERSEIIVFTRTAGFRHDSIAKAADTITPALRDRGFTVTVTEDPTVFAADRLEGVGAIVFLSTTGDVVDDAQQQAIESYVRSGGGWAGVHSATDTEYEWPFYASLTGARFAQHPPDVHEAAVSIEDPHHLSTVGLPERWVRTDEWYDFKTSPRGCVHVLAKVDESTYEGGTMGADHPIMWCHSVGSGRAWYTAMGHSNESWDEPEFKTSVVEGITSVMPSGPASC